MLKCETTTAPQIPASQIDARESMCEMSTAVQEGRAVSFMDLSTELRLLIYRCILRRNYVCRETHTVYRNDSPEWGDCDCAIERPSPNDQDRPIVSDRTAILRVNKKIYNEARHIVFEVAEFAFSLYQLHEQTKFEVIDADLPVLCQTASDTMKRVLRSAHRLAIVCDFADKHSFTPDSVAALEVLWSTSEGAGAALREVKFHVDHNDGCGRSDVDNANWDIVAYWKDFLHKLESTLPSRDKVTISAEYHIVNCVSPSVIRFIDDPELAQVTLYGEYRWASQYEAEFQ